MKRISLFLTFFTSLLSAQSETEPMLDLSRSFTASGLSVPRVEKYLEKNEIPSDISVQQLLNYPDESVRFLFYGRLVGEILNTDSNSDRRSLVELLVISAAEDPRPGYGGWILDNLSKNSRVEVGDFTEYAKEKLRNYDTNRGYTDHYIETLGVAEVVPRGFDLKKLSQQIEEQSEEEVPLMLRGMQFQSTAWKAGLALARWGDKEAIETVMEQVLETRLEDGRLVDLRLYDDLGYARQPEAVDLLVHYLFQEIPPEKERTSGDLVAGAPAIYAAIALSNSLEDYPLGIGIDGVSLKDVEIVREFIRNYEGPWRIIGKWNPEETSREPESINLASTEIENGVPAIDPEIDPSQKTIHEESHAEPSEKKTPPLIWPWIVGAVILLTALGLVLSRKKS